MSKNSIPWWIVKGVPNPMKNKDTVQKMTKSYKETVSSEGYSHPNKGRERPDLVGKSLLSEDDIDKLRLRMTNQNPMKDPEVAKRVSESLTATNSAEGYVHPNTGNERPDSKVRMDSNSNPMKNESSKTKRNASRKIYVDTVLKGPLNPMKNEENVAKCAASNIETRSQPGYVSPIKGENNFMVKNPDAAKAMWKKSRATLQKNGMISLGEKVLLTALDNLDIPYEGQKYFLINKEGIRCCFIDAYLKEIGLAIEYDGFSAHYNQNKDRDRLRDKYLFELHKVPTIRIQRSSVFEKDFPNTLLGVINEFTMEESVPSNFVGRRI